MCQHCHLLTGLGECGEDQEILAAVFYCHFLQVGSSSADVQLHLAQASAFHSTVLDSRLQQADT